MANPTPRHDPVKLTKRAVDAAKPGEREYIQWDTDIKGFGLKITPAGKKSYLFKYRTRDGQGRKPRIGVHGTITTDQAREIAKNWAADVAKGGDPSQERQAARRAAPAADPDFRTVLDNFVEKYAKPRQRTWAETERTLKTNCAGWLDQPISSITRTDAYDLLDGFVADGHGTKARITLAWLKTMWRWAWKREIVSEPLMDAVEIEFEKRIRDRHYSDDEIKAIWKAANQLTPLEGGYVKLVLLLAPRKNELAGMRRSEFDDQDSPTLWTVPFERTKSRKRLAKPRVYLVPLPPLAQRIVKALPRMHDDLVFPGRHKGKPIRPSRRLSDKVREKSGVSDWTYHPCRDTVATWLQNEGHSEFERGLILNHSGAGSVTAGYSHGYPIELKRELLEKWADHVVQMVQPEGVALLT